MIYHLNLLHLCLRFSERIPAREFFERCDISANLAAYCDPEFSLSISSVYVGCGLGGRDLVELVWEHRLRFADQGGNSIGKVAS